MLTLAVAGAGFAGAVLARELAESVPCKIVVFESRDHIGGNCHTERDAKTGVMIHRYGPHIFNTNSREVWDYVNRFGSFGAFTNRVKAVTRRGVFSLPINLLTINQFFGKTFNPREAEEFIASRGDRSIENPKSFEDQALKFLGREQYENFFYGYTKKQWGVEPRDLPASILQRLPVRFNYDDNYYNSLYQGIPLDGYTSIIEKILDHPSIHVQLGESFRPEYLPEFAHVFYSGPIDAYFNFDLGRLQYRSLEFERLDVSGDFQGNPVINYCEAAVPYTRIAEHKHFAPWEEHQESVCFREYSKLTGPKDTPFYPLRLTQDKDLLLIYQDRAKTTPKVTFIGRLGTYRYLDMHVVIGESLALAKHCLKVDRGTWPTFSHSVA